ncbi:MAG: MFS transporter [Anaerolineales bacterium]|nr:MFS transporter [Anaerolineales bacterium]
MHDVWIFILFAGDRFSYFTSLNALYFLSKGLSMADVGIFGAIALIPFVIKVFLGMLSDKVNLFGLGHRKPYIILGLLIQALCLVFVPFIDPADDYWLFVAIAFILQLGMALYDTCTDGLALDTTPVDEQGTIQGFMVGGRAAGVVITASILGWLAQEVSWTAVFWLLGALTLIPLPFVISLQEEERDAGEKFEWSAFSAFKDKQIIALAAAGFLFFLVIAGTNQNVNPFLETEYGISLRMAGFYTTIWGLGVVLGGMLGGQLIDRIGQKKSTRIALFFSFVSILILAVIPNPGFAWPIVFIFGLSYGTYQTVYFALAMHYTEKKIAASMFSIFMAVTNIGQGLGFAVAGGFANIPAVGFRWAFVILALVNLVALPLLPIVFRQNDKN